MTDPSQAYRVYGMTQSYFTRKMTGYLDYKRIPWLLRRFGGVNPALHSAGWPGGIPAIQTPQGEYMWDSTAVIHHLEGLFPEPSVLPSDPVVRFLSYVLEDVADEWLYRPAVGSRWYFEENAQLGGWELARDLTVEVPLTCDQGRTMAGAHVRSSCGPLGVTEENIQSWVDEVLKPWIRVLGRHLRSEAYVLGDRPSLADFAIFGGDAAHFTNDPLCRRWTEAEGPELVRHTHRLLQPEDERFGDWSKSAEISETLVALLADLGRLYLPWVSRATVEEAAELVFESGQRVSIKPTEFLVDARKTLLARYLADRCEPLDAVLDRAGILPFFADFTDQAGSIPDYSAPPRPALNRPFPG